MCTSKKVDEPGRYDRGHDRLKKCPKSAPARYHTSDHLSDPKVPGTFRTLNGHMAGNHLVGRQAKHSCAPKSQQTLHLLPVVGQRESLQGHWRCRGYG